MPILNLTLKIEIKFLFNDNNQNCVCDIEPTREKTIFSKFQSPIDPFEFFAKDMPALTTNSEVVASHFFHPTIN